MDIFKRIVKRTDIEEQSKGCHLTAFTLTFYIERAACAARLNGLSGTAAIRWIGTAAVRWNERQHLLQPHVFRRR